MVDGIEVTMKIEQDLLPYILLFLASGGYFIIAIGYMVKAVKDFREVNFRKKIDIFVKGRGF